MTMAGRVGPVVVTDRRWLVPPEPAMAPAALVASVVVTASASSLMARTRRR